jgi:hypothetical protein
MAVGFFPLALGFVARGKLGTQEVPNFPVADRAMTSGRFVDLAMRSETSVQMCTQGVRFCTLVARVMSRSTNCTLAAPQFPASLRSQPFAGTLTDDRS